MTLSTIVLPKNSILITGVSTNRKIDNNGRVNASKYRNHTYFIHLNNNNSVNYIIKKINFIKKYATFGYEVFVTKENITLLDFPYFVHGDCEENNEAQQKILTIFLEILKNVNTNNTKCFKNTFKNLTNMSLQNNSNLKKMINNKGMCTKTKKTNPDYEFHEYFDLLNINGWMRKSCTSEHNQSDEIMLKIPYVHSKLKRIMPQNINKYLDYDISKLVISQIA